jgi:K+/H+ antiporter YhaU regulatory subunit KhtT
VREQTDCTIVAIRGEDGGSSTNPGPTPTLTAGREMILVGSVESERKFLAKFAGG